MPATNDVPNYDVKDYSKYEPVSIGYPDEMTPPARQRFYQASAYVWGREDMGDSTLKELLLRSQGYDRGDPSWVFACFAGGQAKEFYSREGRTVLQNIRSQYEDLVGLLEAGKIRSIDKVAIGAYQDMMQDTPA